MQKILTNNKGHLFVISAPAGTGKTTLVNRLKKEFPTIVESVSCTTRAPRKGEVEGEDYFYLSQSQFDEKIQKDEFLEYAKVFDHNYGTTKKFVNNTLHEKKHVVLVIDTQGAMQIKQKEKDAIFIFIAPPSKEAQIKRLHKRDSEDPNEQSLRLSWSNKEMQAANSYDYLIINDDVEIAYEVLKSIFIAVDHKTQK